MSKVVMCLRWGELDSCDINPECAGLWESSSGFAGCAFHLGEQILQGALHIQLEYRFLAWLWN